MHKRDEPRKGVALVTGSSSGFGLQTVIALASKGYEVAATMRNLGAKAELLQEAQSRGLAERVHCYQLDVTDTAAMKPVVEQVERQLGPLDVLVNNAGYAAGGSVEDVPMSEWRAQFETNVFGVMELTKLVVPSMRERGRGMIINVSSVSGRIGFPGYGPYAASKFALEGFSEALRLELLPFGVYVVLLEPGAYRTAIWQKGFDRIFTREGSPYQAMMNSILQYSRSMAEQAPHPSEVAEKIAELAEASYPRLRYPMGKGSRMLLFLRQIVPWKWYENTLHRLIKK
ncbi:SDR family oxidoreductase [Paenibacillus senegalensis]|uniref:SDR family oxidoreductase n=1 Tax=Paenibacillus senegalensis TaxID=1465766 RepID=UPI00028865DC